MLCQLERRRVIRLEVYGRIYAIENLLTHKIYVGQTIQNVRKRINSHKCGKKQLIDKSIQKYGWENFFWCVLEECETHEALNEAEQRWIKKFNSQCPNGYNLNSGGDIHFHPTKEVRRKQSVALKGRVFTQEHKYKIAKALKGQIIPQEQLFKSSIAQKKIFYPNLEKELEKRQLTHNDFARRLNVGLKIGTITAKLNGARIMDEKTAQAIKNFLGVDMPLEELFKKNDE